MLQIFLVAAGGAIGAVLRFMTGLIVVRVYGKSNVITGTVIANIAGCFLVGILFGLINAKGLFHNDIILFMTTGVLGSYTTFSSFTLEFVRLAKSSLKKTFQYLFLQLIVAFGMVFLGYSLAQIFFGSAV